MSATVFEKLRGSREWWVRFTVPRSRCVTTSSHDRRATVKVGPRAVATAIAQEANGLLTSAHLQDIPVRAKDLLRQAALQLRGRHQGASPEAAAITVGEYGPSWLQTTKGSTRQKYDIVFRRHIVPTFGVMPLNRISKRLVSEWLQGLESELAPATAMCYFSIFIAMLAQAVRDEEIRQHPCPTIRSIRSSKPKAAPTEPRFLSYEELANLICALRAIDNNFNRRGAIEFQAALREDLWRRGLIEAELATEKTKLRNKGFGTHVLRHTWATHRLQEGVPPPDVAKALGHSLQTLMKTYAHAMPAENRDRLRVDLDAIV